MRRTGLITRGGFNVEIRLEGDWFRLQALLSDFGPKMMVIANEAQYKFAEKLRDRIKTHIRTGGRRFGYPSHSSAYATYKSRYGAPSRLLYWSGAFHDAVQVRPLRGNRVGVGIPRGVDRNPYRSGERMLSISEYANVLEKGAPSRNIPPRPVFSDTFRKDMGGIKAKKLFLQSHIVRRANQMGIRINKML